MPITRVVLFVISGLGAVYLALVVLVFFFQRSLQYFPDPEPPKTPPDLEEVQIVSERGVTLKGWIAPGMSKQKAALLFHGNGGNRQDFMHALYGFRSLGYWPLMIDYRGYGGSDGSPSESGLYADGQAAWDWLRGQGAQEVVVWGYSLGSAVAVEIARRESPSALVLDAPFDSAVKLAATIYPWLPVRLLLRDRYDSISKIREVHCPVIVTHGASDRIIPATHGRALFERANEPKQWHVVARAGHNNLHAIAGRSYWQRLDAFFTRTR